MRVVAALLLLALWIDVAPADTPAPQTPRVFVSRRGDVFVALSPERANVAAAGVAYRLQDDGRTIELWRVKGWYAFEALVADDGHGLVRMGLWAVGSVPEKDDLAVAFYRDGQLRKQYSTVDLVKDPSKVVRTASHYFWRAEEDPRGDDDARRMRLRPRLEDDEFHLHTIDGLHYTFAVKSGDIRAVERTK